MNNRQIRDDSSRTSVGNIRWSDIDPVRFFGFGTAMYSSLNILLHPISVVKTRRQVLLADSKMGISSASRATTMPSVTTGNASSESLAFLRRQNLSETRVTGITEAMKSSLIEKNPASALMARIDSMYRGVGVILTVAIPARVVYIAVLEGSRETINNRLSSLLTMYLSQRQQTRQIKPPRFQGRPLNGDDDDVIEISRRLAPWIASISGGIAGGLASVTTQAMVVPMDVIAQRQMVMDDATFRREGNAITIIRTLLETEGIRGLYRGFRLSLFTSLPGGSLWWATYSGCQERLSSSHFILPSLSQIDSFHNDDNASYSFRRRALVQIISGFSAAVVSAIATQPLDVVKTRLQVCTNTHPNGQSITATASPTIQSVVQELMQSSGAGGFFRGLMPRILHIGLWGTLMSSAYEMLKHVSRKDFPLV